jgi:type IV secretory pathway VirB10-like protein
MAFSVTCPQCRAILKSAAPIPAGKKVKCPKCGVAFATPALEEGTAVSTEPLPPSTSAASADADLPELEVAPDEDAPPPPKKRRDEPEEDAEPRRRKRERDDDEDEADRGDEPRSRRKLKRKKGGMGVGMLIGLLLGGGLLLFVGCVGCGGLGYWIYTLVNKSPIVGTWEHTNNPFGLKVTNTFNSDGHGNTKVGNVLISYKYRLDGPNLTIEADQLAGGPILPKGLNPVERYTVTFVGNDEMLLRSVNNPFMVGEQRFRRVR